MSVEQEIKDAFQGLADDVEPEPAAWEGARKRIEQFHRRRLAVVACALALIVSAALLTVSRTDRTSPVVTAATSPGWTTYRDPDFGWTLRYPKSWHIQPFKTRSEFQVMGVLIANVDHEFAHPYIPNGGTSAWDMRGLPDNLVVIQFGHIAMRPNCVRPDTPLPVFLDDTRTVTTPDNFGQPQPDIYIQVTARGDSRYGVLAWVANGASPSDRGLGRQIVASLSFARAKDAADPGVLCPSPAGK